MPIDVEAIRKGIAQHHITWTINVQVATAMLDEIEQLRAQVAELERYKANFWKAYAEDEKKRQMRGDVDA